MRIVSLIASATEIVHSLGLGDFQVGRSHECDYPPAVRDLPVCTTPVFDIDGNSREIDQRVRETLANAESVYRVFDDVLKRLKPTHILTQTQCKVCAVSLGDVERALSSRFSTRPQVVALEPNSLDDIFDDIRRVAHACGVSYDPLVTRMHTEMASVACIARMTESHRRVINVEWQEPLMPAGNWIPELVAMLGAENISWRTWEDIVAASPDAIVCMPCGYDLKRAREEMHWLTTRREFASLREHVYITDANQFMTRPGPRVVESLRIFAEILYPESFEPALEGTGWEKF